MNVRMIVASAAAGLALFAAGAADAALVLKGSWRLTDGPSSIMPLSGREAAAQLFGGSPADYQISTLSNVVNNQAFYLVAGIPGAVLIDGQDTTSFFGLDASAYAFDPDIAQSPDRYINYAFVERTVGPGIPEPATWALLIGGFGLAGGALRRRRSSAALG